MKRIIQITIYLLFSLSALVAFPEVVEELTIEGSIHTEDMLSKKMIIIDSEEIEKLGIIEISDLFKIISSIDVNRRGPGMTSFDLTMRGSNFEQILLMVNGIPVNNGQTGHFNTDLTFAVGDIERIEVSQGANSVFHGSNGFAGIINIVLKERSGFRMGLTGGENSLSQFSVSAGSKYKKLSFGFSAEDSSSTGYYEGQEFDNLNLRTFISFSNSKIGGKLNFGYLKKAFGAKDFYAPYPSFENIESGNINFNLHTKGKILHRISFSHIIHKDSFVLDRYNHDFFNSESTTNHTYLKFHNTIRSGILLFSGGADLEMMKMDSSTMGYQNQSRSGIYFAGGLKNPGWGLDLGARINYSTDHKSYFTYYAGVYRIFKNRDTLRFNIGKAVRYPSFTEMFYNSPANKGDTDLQPENSSNFEISFLRHFKNFNISISGFYRKQDHMIDWIRAFDESIWRAANVEKNDVSGYELVSEFILDGARFKAILEKIFVVGNHHNFISKYGFRFPELKLNFIYMQRLNENLNFSAKYIYKRIYETREKASLLDINLSWQLKGVNLSIHADNLLNSVIEEIPGVKIPGRWLWISLKYQK